MTPLRCDSHGRTMHAVNFNTPICTHQLPTDFLDDSLVFSFAPTLPKAPSALYIAFLTSLRRRIVDMRANCPDFSFSLLILHSEV